MCNVYKYKGSTYMQILTNKTLHSPFSDSHAMFRSLHTASLSSSESVSGSLACGIISHSSVQAKIISIIFLSRSGALCLATHDEYVAV